MHGRCRYRCLPGKSPITCTLQSIDGAELSWVAHVSLDKSFNVVIQHLSYKRKEIQKTSIMLVLYSSSPTENWALQMPIRGRFFFIVWQPSNPPFLIKKSPHNDRHLKCYLPSMLFPKATGSMAEFSGKSDYFHSATSSIQIKIINRMDKTTCTTFFDCQLSSLTDCLHLLPDLMMAHAIRIWIRCEVEETSRTSLQYFSKTAQDSLDSR
jgi:hypothetical protein